MNEGVCEEERKKEGKGRIECDRGPLDLRGTGTTSTHRSGFNEYFEDAKVRGKSNVSIGIHSF